MIIIIFDRVFFCSEIKYGCFGDGFFSQLRKKKKVQCFINKPQKFAQGKCLFEKWYVFSLSIALGHNCKCDVYTMNPYIFMFMKWMQRKKGTILGDTNFEKEKRI